MTHSHDALDKLIALEIDARKFGFDWTHREMVIDQAISECEEIRDAIAQGESDERIQEEIGDLIHTAISLCIFAGYDTKATIEMMTKKFGARMQKVKEITAKRGLANLEGKSWEYMIEIWNEAKKQC